ncbi:Polynucleotide 5'-hydroxyl-kinase grc3 [Savitreella phatthalungensis]
MKRKRSQPTVSAFAARRLAAQAAVEVVQEDEVGNSDGETQDPVDVPPSPAKTDDVEFIEAAEQDVIQRSVPIELLETHEEEGATRILLKPGQSFTVHGICSIHLPVDHRVLLDGSHPPCRSTNTRDCLFVNSSRVHGFVTFKARDDLPEHDKVPISLESASTPAFKTLHRYGLLKTCYHPDIDAVLALTDGKRPRDADAGGLKSFLIEPHGNERSLQTPVGWQALIDDCLADREAGSEAVGEQLRILLVVGGKNSGKTTLCRMICQRMRFHEDEHTGFLVDLDPGQSDLAPPGVLAACPIKTTRYARSALSDPMPDNDAPTLQQWYGSTTPKDDTTAYLDKCEALVELVLEQLRRPTSQAGHRRPIIIVNTPGWITGSGLDLLVQLSLILSATGSLELVKMTEVDILDRFYVGRADDISQDEIKVWDLAPDRPAAARPTDVTAAILRQICMIEYFHRSSANAAPLIEQPEWQVLLDATCVQNAQRTGAFNVCGFDIGDTELAPADLLSAVNGTICAMVLTYSEEESADDMSLKTGYEETSHPKCSALKIRRRTTYDQQATNVRELMLGLCIVKGFTFKRCAASDDVPAADRTACIVSLISPVQYDRLELRGAKQELWLHTGKIEMPACMILDRPSNTALTTNAPYVDSSTGKGQGRSVLHVRRNLGRRSQAHAAT